MCCMFQFTKSITHLKSKYILPVQLMRLKHQTDGCERPAEDEGGVYVEYICLI